MEIKVGRYYLRSDAWCLWIEEEYQSKGKDGKPGRVQRRKVAGYTNSIDTLIRQFLEHKHRASEATTVAELIKEWGQIADDAMLLKKTAIKADLRAMRQTAKKVDEINKGMQ